MRDAARDVRKSLPVFERPSPGNVRQRRLASLHLLADLVLGRNDTRQVLRALHGSKHRAVLTLSLLGQVILAGRCIEHGSDVAQAQGAPLALRQQTAAGQRPGPPIAWPFSAPPYGRTGPRPPRFERTSIEAQQTRWPPYELAEPFVLSALKQDRPHRSSRQFLRPGRQRPFVHPAPIITPQPCRGTISVKTEST